MIISPKDFYLNWIFKNDNRYYLLIIPEVKGSPESYLQVGRSRFLEVVDFDTIPYYCLRVRRGWTNAIRKVKINKPNLLFSLLHQFINENGIKKYYYDVWLNNHNYQSQKQNRRDFQTLKTLKNKGIKVQNFDGYIKHLTTNMGVKEASKMSII